MMLLEILADGAWGHMSGAGWWWMMIIGSLFWVSIVGLAAWAIVRSNPGRPTRADPEDILAERFALGEISAAEFAERRAALREDHTETSL